MSIDFDANGLVLWCNRFGFDLYGGFYCGTTTYPTPTQSNVSICEIWSAREKCSHHSQVSWLDHSFHRSSAAAFLFRGCQVSLFFSLFQLMFDGDFMECGLEHLPNPKKLTHSIVWFRIYFSSCVFRRVSLCVCVHDKQSRYGKCNSNSINTFSKWIKQTHI